MCMHMLACAHARTRVHARMHVYTKAHTHSLVAPPLCAACTTQLGSSLPSACERVQDVLGLAKLKILGDKLNKRDRKRIRGQHTQVRFCRAGRRKCAQGAAH